MRYSILYLVILALCGHCAKPVQQTHYAHLEADDTGQWIRRTGEGEYPPTLRFEPLEYRKVGDSIHVPVRVTCLHSGGVYTFDSTELTDQYTEYMNNSAQLLGARVAYQRQKELYEARVTSEKEFLESRIKFQEYTRTVAKIENNFRILGIPLPVIKHLRSGWILLTGDVPENELRSVHKGMKIQIELHAYTGKIVEVTIAGISEQINPGTRTAKIFMSLNNHKGMYSPGMFGAGLIERTGKKSLAIPAAAVVQIGAKSYVFRAKDADIIERVEIETGAEDNGFIAVTSGVKEGEKIVTRGASLLKGLSFGY
jgi:membrane fusion protein, heavy metal efflux system